MRGVIICCPDYDANSGGALVLHKLADLLESVTTVIKVRLVPARTDGSHGWTLAPCGVDDNLIRLCSSGTVKVIYPESVSGNPLRAKHVIRWLLSTPNLICDTQIDFENEKIYAYISAFGPKYPLLRITSELELPAIPSKKTVNVAYLVKKAPRYNIEIPKICEQWVNIDGLDLADQLTILSNTKYFISFDPHTMLSTFASLVGCRSVVPTVPGKTQRDLYSSDEIAFIYGEFKNQSFSGLKSRAEKFMANQQKITIADFRNFCACELGI